MKFLDNIGIDFEHSEKALCTFVLCLKSHPNLVSSPFYTICLLVYI